MPSNHLPCRVALNSPGIIRVLIPSTRKEMTCSGIVVGVRGYERCSTFNGSGFIYTTPADIVREPVSKAVLEHRWRYVLTNVEFRRDGGSTCCYLSGSALRIAEKQETKADIDELTVRGTGEVTTA